MSYMSKHLGYNHGTRQDNNYRRMAEKLRDMQATPTFLLLHHFSDPKFKSRPVKLEKFCKYCDGVNNMKEEGENPQTIRRVGVFVETVKNRSYVDTAIKAAWEQYPLVTR